MDIFIKPKKNIIFINKIFKNAKKKHDTGIFKKQSGLNPNITIPKNT